MLYMKVTKLIAWTVVKIISRGIVLILAESPIKMARMILNEMKFA